MLLRIRYSIIFYFLSLYLLSGCQFTQEQQATFDTEKAAIARLKLGLGYLAQSDDSNENIKRAHYNLTLANEYSPNNPNIMLGLALFDQHVGEYKEAELLYKNIIQIQPYNGLFFNHYGSFLCATNRYTEAKQQFLKAIELNKPKWKIDGLEQLGYCAIQNNDTFEANRAFKQLFQYDITARERVIKEAYQYREKGAIQIADYLDKILLK